MLRIEWHGGENSVNQNTKALAVGSGEINLYRFNCDIDLLVCSAYVRSCSYNIPLRFSGNFTNTCSPLLPFFMNPNSRRFAFGSDTSRSLESIS